MWNGYRIEPKQDFGPNGFLIEGRWVKSGFVVTKQGCNVMPGATWFETEPEAKKGIAALELAKQAARTQSDIPHCFWMFMELAR